MGRQAEGFGRWIGGEAVKISLHQSLRLASSNAITRSMLPVDRKCVSLLYEVERGFPHSRLPDPSAGIRVQRRVIQRRTNPHLRGFTSMRVITQER